MGHFKIINTTCANIFWSKYHFWLDWILQNNYSIVTLQEFQIYSIRRFFWKFADMNHCDYVIAIYCSVSHFIITLLIYTATSYFSDVRTSYSLSRNWFIWKEACLEFDNQKVDSSCGYIKLICNFSLAQFQNFTIF